MNPIKAYLAKIGRKGGKAKSKAKAEAARRNARNPRPRRQLRKLANQIAVADKQFGGAISRLANKLAERDRLALAKATISTMVRVTQS